MNHMDRPFVNTTVETLHLLMMMVFRVLYLHFVRRTSHRSIRQYLVIQYLDSKSVSDTRRSTLNKINKFKSDSIEDSQEIIIL